MGKSTRSIRRWRLPVAEERDGQVLYRRRDVELEDEARRAADQNQAQPGGGRLLVPRNVPLGGNFLRMAAWNLCRDLSRFLQHSIAVGARDWRERFEMSEEQIGAVVSHVAVTLPMIIDLYLCKSYEELVRRAEGMGSDELVSKLLGGAYQIRSQPWKEGEFWNSCKKDELPERVSELLTPAVLKFIKARRGNVSHD